MKAIKATKRKTLLIAGTLTSVCMAFPTLSALAGVVQAGAMPIDTYAVLAELMSTWDRPDAMDFAAVMVEHIVPPHRALKESSDKAQSVQKVGHETKLELLQAQAMAVATYGHFGERPASILSRSRETISTRMTVSQSD